MAMELVNGHECRVYEQHQLFEEKVDVVITETPEGTKVCLKCGEVKSLDEFHVSPNGSQGKDAYCKPCRAGISRDNEFGPGASEWVRQKLKEQGGVCACCGTKECGEKGWCLDHDHRYAKKDRRGWRGVLGTPCNGEEGKVNAYELIFTGKKPLPERKEQVMAYRARHGLETTIFKTPQAKTTGPTRQEESDVNDHEMMCNEARVAWLQARAVVKLPPLPKTAEGHAYRYLPLDQLLALVRQPLLDQGLMIRWESDSPNADLLRVRCVLEHVGGWQESAELMVAPNKEVGGRMSGIQARGATVTFLCRYTLLCVLGATADEDVDGVHYPEDHSIAAQRAGAVQQVHPTVTAPPGQGTAF